VTATFHLLYVGLSTGTHWRAITWVVKLRMGTRGSDVSVPARALHSWAAEG